MTSVYSSIVYIVVYGVCVCVLETICYLSTHNVQRCVNQYTHTGGGNMDSV